MEDENETKAQLLQEISTLRQRVATLEAAEAQSRQVIDDLRHHKALVATAFKTSPDAITITRLRDGQLIEINDSFKAITGYSRDEVIGQTTVELNIWLDAHYRDRFVTELTTHGIVSNMEIEFETKAGSIRAGLISAKIIDLGDEPHILSIIRDITQWKKAEAKIRQHSKKLELLDRIAAASAANFDPNSFLELACRELAESFLAPCVSASMFSKDKSTAMVVSEYVVGERLSVRNRVTPVEGDVVAQYLLQTRAPLVLPHAQSDLYTTAFNKWMEKLGLAAMLLIPLIVEDEVIGSLEIYFYSPRQFTSSEVNLAWSVSDQVAGAVAKAWLNEERRLLSTAINQAADIIVVTDDQGTILYANPAFEQITGFARVEVIGKRPFILPGGAHDTAFYDAIWSTIRAGQVWQGNITGQTKDGSPLTTKTTITPVKDDSGKIVNYVSTQVDVTRELALEKQYRQAQKMEAIGQLTAGIAHDFNNLLMAINGFAELMQFRLPKDSPFQDMASRIVASGESAANLIRQLLVFSRKQIVEPQVINLNDTVTEIDKMLRRIIGEDINLQTRLYPQLWSIKLDPSQVEQIIVNLAVNARDAMPTGGQLTLETTNMQIKNQTADLLRLQPGDYVVLSVIDTGVGMNETTKSRIFEPFFTTKEHGKGTGLGLATVYGIVKQNGGDIQVYSREGEGSTFEIYLPRATDAVIAAPAEAGAEKLSKGTETVLLVEDSSAVRELVTLTLTAQGYNVVKATNGAEALTLFKNHEGEIHLLLTDIVMPQMGGKELADRVSEINPNIKVIFTSGYSNDAISHYGVLDPEIVFLQKPFSPGELVAKVRQVLDTP